MEIVQLSGSGLGGLWVRIRPGMGASLYRTLILIELAEQQPGVVNNIKKLTTDHAY